MEMKVFVSVLVRREGKLLIVREQKKSNYNKWNYPGGHLEAGEPVLAGAIREIREETGLAVELVGLLGVYNWTAGEIHSVRFVFMAETTGGEARAGDEILEVKWVGADEIATMNDEELVGRGAMRQIAEHFRHGTLYSLDAVVEQDRRVTFGAYDKGNS